MSITRLKELMVLSTLRAHPLHGYALVEALDHGLGWTLGLTRPTVYAIEALLDQRRGRLEALEGLAQTALSLLRQQVRAEVETLEGLLS